MTADPHLPERTDPPFIVRAAAMSWGAVGLTTLLLGVQHLLMPWIGWHRYLGLLVLAVGLLGVVIMYGLLKLRRWSLALSTFGGGGVLVVLIAWVVICLVLFGFFSMMAFFAAGGAGGAFGVTMASRPSAAAVLKARARLKAEGLALDY